MTQLALQLRLRDIVDEYDHKLAGIDALLESYKQVCTDLESGSRICGEFGNSLQFGHIQKSQLEQSLLKSAWRYVFRGLNIATIASATDRKRFEQEVERASTPFTLENIKATFGDYILNPRLHILKGLAEVFCQLDPAYKSHDKVKIGVQGLPKRIILSNVAGYGWGRERLTDVINALAALQGKPLASYGEIGDLLKDGDCMTESRGVWLKKFANGNGHLFFAPQELRDINKGLAEYYGEVLADAAGEKPTQKQQSTEVSKDLQYYPTPQKVVNEVISQLSNLTGAKVLEPSCGCGRFMDVLRSKGADVFGIEFDAGRADICRNKGHKVMQANFLETVPTPDYDRIVMNPPFYGKHYAKHVEHAFKFLKQGGILTAILPATARYDHKLLDGAWYDLPVGSFAESGTNINISVLTMRKP